MWIYRPVTRWSTEKNDDEIVGYQVGYLQSQSNVGIHHQEFVAVEHYTRDAPERNKELARRAVCYLNGGIK